MDRETIRRRRLPHWDVPGGTYFVTSCLAGSIPAKGWIDLARYRNELARYPRPAGMSEAEAASNQWKRTFVRMDRWLDEEPGVRWFDDLDLAGVAVDTLYYFADRQYDLLGFVVMPSHFHWVFRPREEWSASLEGTATARERICKSRNQHIAIECNRRLGRIGAFWQHEGYDRWIRDADELERILLYIEGNPVKAGLATRSEEYRFSSAFDRKRSGLELGQPLTR